MRTEQEVRDRLATVLAINAMAVEEGDVEMLVMSKCVAIGLLVALGDKELPQFDGVEQAYLEKCVKQVKAKQRADEFTRNARWN